MARQTQISIEEIQGAKQLRDQATMIAEYRKALDGSAHSCGLGETVGS